MTRVYWLSMGLSLLQGIGFAMFDCGSKIEVFGLWKGISDSPINIIHGGYGLGALLILNILTPYLKFNSQINGSNLTTSDDITLQTPYSIAAGLAIVCAIAFSIAQYYQLQHGKMRKTIAASIERSSSENNEDFQPSTFSGIVE